MGHLATREDSSRDAGHRGRNTGRPGIHGTVGKPTVWATGQMRTAEICWHESQYFTTDTCSEHTCYYPALGGLVC